MQRYQYLIIGGGIAGVTAAETIRERDSQGAIAVICEEPHLLYSRVLLPAYLKQRINREQLFLRRSDDFTKNRIDLRLHEEVAEVDLRLREVRMTNHQGLAFERLLIATGGRVRPWGEPRDQQVVYRLQTLDDADRMREDLHRIRAPVVIGTSFIGLEFLEIFVENGAHPFILSRDPYYFSHLLGPEGGTLLMENFSVHGIDGQYGDSIREIAHRNGRVIIGTEQFQEYDCDAIAVGIGIERNRSFLKGIGVAVGNRGVLVNEFLETDAEGVWAAGDVVEFRDPEDGRTRTLGNWTSAFLSGRQAGLNMAGAREPFLHVETYAITSFGMQITAVGDCTVDGSESIEQQRPRDRSYHRFFIRGGRLRGAVLINSFRDKPHVTALIANRVPVAPFASNLSDPAFDIKNIPVVS